MRPRLPLLLAVLLPLLAPGTSAQRRSRGPEPALSWRCIGPANMMGRIASIDALDTDHRTVLVASASGGVFLSRNAGITWDSIFDHHGAGSIGAAVFFQADPDVIWVGTGEAANRNSSGWGDGVYRSTDGGRSFDHLGLKDTHHIAEIAPHPTDPDIAYVASPGHLWGYSGSRGLFKTTDGGRTWALLGGGLPEDGKTGCTEVILDPRDPEIVYAGMYHRLRGPASMHSGGEGGGIYKSTDGGASFRRLSEGLPTGDTGMIDLAIHRADPDILVANVEADEDLPDDLSVPGPGVYLSRDAGQSWTYLLRHDTRPFYHGQVDIDPQDPDRLYAVSRDFQVSRDGGQSWRRKWWGGGGDDHDLWISPTDGDVWYNATDQGAYLTVDGGRSLLAFDNMAIGQYYAIAVDLRDPYWVVGGLQDNGLWMGPSHSRERRGILNLHNTWIGEGDGFHCQVDPTDWRTVYTVNHCGFLARQNVETREHRFITPTPETVRNFDEWFDPEHPDPPIRYTIQPGEQWFFGEDPQRPRLPPQFRFAWSSPMVLSPTNPHTVYFGGNHLFRSTDRGETWRIVSPDLSTDDPALRRPSEQGGLTRSVTGGENHCTIVTLAESPVDPAVIWCGTDDGRLQVTRDGGATWTDVRPAVQGVPDGAWVSRVEASHFEAGRCYVCFDDHRRDDMRAFVQATEDFGATWTDRAGGLPEASLYVVREDPINPDLLFVGSEFAVHLSLDRGASWTRMEGALPTVAIHDLVIHPRDGDLVAGTHGRSLWICDDISPLRQSTAAVRAKDFHLFEPRRATRWVSLNLGRKQPDFLFRGQNPPSGALLHFQRRGEAEARVRIEVEQIASERRWSTEVRVGPGLHRVRWPLSFPPTAAEREATRRRLHEALRLVASRVSGDEAHAALDGLAQRLDAADDERSLNAIRERLVEDFGAHAGGRPIFGPRLESTPAPAGSYRVRATCGERVETVRLEVREDPLRHP